MYEYTKLLISFISTKEPDCSCENMYMHRCASIDLGTAMRIRGHAHTLKYILKVLYRQEVQIHKSAGPIQMFKAKNVLGCF